MLRTISSALSAFVCLSLLPGPAVAAEPPPEGPRPQPVEPPVTPPVEPRPSTDPEPPPPSLAPVISPGEDRSGIEFSVPPPEEHEQEGVLGPQPELDEPVLFPDPGFAPSDGVDMLVLSGTTIALTLIGFSAGLTIGLQRQIELEWLLPSTIVPAVGLLAFGGGGLYLGITRARAYRRWEIGNRVIGLPQGRGLMVGGSFGLLGALGLIPAGAFMVDGNPEWGGTLIAVGVASAIATPVMFVIGARNQRRYQQTGGWKRKPIPPLPPGANGSAALELRPMVSLLPGGASVGAAGRF
ncbi:MAG: hypothetical protein R6X02_19065 [Enhygromyxa sp.]